MIYISAILLGLAGSLHCIAMCGPFMAAISAPFDRPASFVPRWVLHHLGRLLGYAAIGLVFGLAGRVASLVIMQQWVMVLAGALMILGVLIGLLKTRVSGPMWFQRFTNAFMSAGCKMSAEGKAGGWLLLGIANGLVPCGLVYAAAGGAVASASPWGGALFMVAFGIGNLPVLSVLSFGKWLFKFKPVLRSAWARRIPVLLIGVLFVLKGAGIGIPFLSPKIVADKHGAKSSCCKPAH